MDIDAIIEKNLTAVSDEYRAFLKKKLACQRCSIWNEYKQVVCSDGNAKNPTFVFVGESPGKDELSEGKPFVGRAGQCLRNVLRRHKKTFNRNTTLLTNLLPCRPLNNKFPYGKANKDYKMADSLSTLDAIGLTPKMKRATAIQVVRNCLDEHLIEELKILRPKVIVTLGAQPLYWLTEMSGITDNRGKWQRIASVAREYDLGAWVFSTYHPSYVIRCKNTGDKHIVEQFEEDLKTVAETWATVTSKHVPRSAAAKPMTVAFGDVPKDYGGYASTEEIEDIIAEAMTDDITW